MRIALPLSGGLFSQHFGQASAFWLCDVEQNQPEIVAVQELPMPEGGGCGVIPAMLAKAGVNLVIAGGMGAGAVQNLTRCGIEVVTGVAGGTPRQIVQDYLAGRLASTGELCRHHESHAEHDHEGGCHKHG